MNGRSYTAGALAALALLGGCAVGPNYLRPEATTIPAAYAGADGWKVAQPQAQLPKGNWWEIFADPQLDTLEAQAVAANQQLKAAVERFAEARATTDIARAQLFPNVSLSASYTRQQTSRNAPSVATGNAIGHSSTFNDFLMPLDVGYEVDLWGRLRRSTESARASLLNAEENRKAVVTTLVSDVATDYFNLLQLDYELEISKRTLNSRQGSLQLTQTLEQHGINSLLDVRQSEQLVYTAATEIPDLERQIAQQENAISILLGNNPGDVPRGLKLTEQPHAPEVPVGLPSSLLSRRPDILQAEQNLVAANAQIGVARAAYFPQIALTGSAGYQSTALSNLFTGPAGIWNMAASFTQPIFEGGRLKSNVRLAEAQREQLLLTYQQAIQGAFRDVSNALVAYRKNREFRIQQEHLVEAARDAARLSEVRFKVGTTDYLEVLTNNTNSFSAELGLAQAQGNELTALVQLYQSLGGGWQQ